MDSLFSHACRRAGKVASLLAVLVVVLWWPRPAAAANLMQETPATPEPAPVTPADPAGHSRSPYTGTVRGFVVSNPMHEQWSFPATGQTADVYEEMQYGALRGSRAGFLPVAFNHSLALEVENSRQSAAISTISSPGFTVGKQTVAAFTTEAEDSSIAFQSTFFNILLRPAEGPIRPYLGVGPGLTRSIIDFNEESVTSEGFGFTEGGEVSGFSYQLLAGVELDVTARLSVGIGYRYFAANPTFTWANTSQSTYDPRTHNFVFTVTVR